MLAVPNREHIEVSVFDLYVRFGTFDATENKYPLLLDLLGDQVPLDFRQVVELNYIAFLICN